MIASFSHACTIYIIYIYFIYIYVCVCVLYIEEENGNPVQYSFLENPMESKPGRLQSVESQRVRHN